MNEDDLLNDGYKKGINIDDDFLNSSKKIFNLKSRRLIIKSIFYILLINIEFI